MLVRMKDLAMDRERRLCEVPLGHGRAAPPEEEEQAALMAFGSFAIEVPDEALPLQLFYVNGNQGDVMISPKVGRLETARLVEIRNDKKQRLQFMAEPFGSGH